MSQSESHQIPATRAQYLQQAAELFAKRGLDLTNLLHDGALPEDLVLEEHDFVPTLSLNRLVYAGAAQLGEQATINVLHSLFQDYCIPSVLSLFKPYLTMAAALEQVSEIFTLDSPGSAIFITQEQGKVWFCRKAYNDPLTQADR